MVNFLTLPKMRRLDAEGLWNYALQSLARRAHSIGELREKLRVRAEHSDDVGAVLARLKEYGYLDDRRFAESFASARLENAGLGKARVLRDLRQRRIAPELAARTVQQAYQDVSEPELIEKHLRRHFRARDPRDLLQDERAIASAYRRLLRAGFTPGNILQTLKKFARNPELLDRLE